MALQSVHEGASVFVAVMVRKALSVKGEVVARHDTITLAKALRPRASTESPSCRVDVSY